MCSTRKSRPHSTANSSRSARQPVCVRPASTPPRTWATCPWCSAPSVSSAASDASGEMNVPHFAGGSFRRLFYCVPSSKALPLLPSTCRSLRDLPCTNRWTRQTKVLTQRHPPIVPLIEPPPLQLRDDVGDEI